ncbi:hypothetical protein MAPG_03080 [Magnaporthiopsis poae ATCC 64411]|uniref:Uncharacterized protein n=1 Tax=Magnaporthiopsis poae (strain ATCC 64411 / 73-15) TaxID=644358 RepID=A0A0C4DT27_MAGP6|nr:hypothetical protein MAPG_03080 [Magnaporthiopsis poae ATCC 64411]
MLSFIATKWPRLFFSITSFQAIICLVFEGYVFGRFQSSLKYVPPDLQSPLEGAPAQSIPTFLALFIFGFLFQVVLVWDALRMKNTIQVIGICVSNLAMMLYTVIQIDQIRQAIDTLALHNRLENTTSSELWGDCQPLLIAIPIIVALCTLGMGFVAWKLYQEFAWDILKQIGADYRMKRRFLHYQVYIALLKFDFFFFLGFTVQFLVIVGGSSGAETVLTGLAIPVTIAILLFAAFFTRRENKIGMGCVMVLYFGGLSYFFFKLVRIYQPSHREKYKAIERSLTAFAVLTIILIILTITNAFVCMNNFGAGLKNHLNSPPRGDEEKPDAHSISLHDVKPQLPSRMTID